MILDSLKERYDLHHTWSCHSGVRHILQQTAVLIELVLNRTFSKLTIASGKLHIAAFAHAEKGHFLHYPKLRIDVLRRRPELQR